MHQLVLMGRGVPVAGLKIKVLCPPLLWKYVTSSRCSFKSRTCARCKVIEERKHDRKTTTLEYLDLVINHEPDCYINHDSSPQVSNVTYLWNFVYIMRISTNTGNEFVLVLILWKRLQDVLCLCMVYITFYSNHALGPDYMEDFIPLCRKEIVQRRFSWRKSIPDAGNEQCFNELNFSNNTCAQQ